MSLPSTPWALADSFPSVVFCKLLCKSVNDSQTLTSRALLP
jgi:hypothetical protein